MGLKVSIANKNRLYRHYLKTRTCYSHTKFKCYQNKLNHLLRLSKTNYYKEYFIINKTKTKEIWKGINQLICLKSKGSMLPSKLIINEHEITNDKAIAYQLNKFFSNIGKNLALTVPKPNLPFNCYLDKPQASSFFLSPTTPTEIENIIMSLSSTKASGPFSISTSLLFLLCINDMPKCSNILEFHLFADDTNLFFNNPNILNLETILNVELEKVSQ